MSKKNDSTTAIVMAASACFEKKGVRGTTLREIAEAAGVSLSELRSAFKYKSLIALAVQAHDLDEAQSAYRSAMPNASLRELIAFTMQSRYRFAEEHYELTLLFFQKALAGAQPWNDKLTHIIWELSLEFASLIEKGLRDGYLKKGLDTNAAVKALTSFYMTGLVHGLRDTEFVSEVVWEFVEPQVNLLVDGMKA